MIRQREFRAETGARQEQGEDKFEICRKPHCSNTQLHFDGPHSTARELLFPVTDFQDLLVYRRFD
jgi:hypothetical protein